MSALSPDGRLLAVAYRPILQEPSSTDAVIRLWDPITGQSRGSLAGHASFVSALAFSRDGSRLFSASADGTVRAWQMFAGPNVRTSISAAQFDSLANEVYITGQIHNDDDKPIILTRPDIALAQASGQALTMTQLLPTLPSTIKPGETLSFQLSVSVPPQDIGTLTLSVFDQSFHVSLRS